MDECHAPDGVHESIIIHALGQPVCLFRMPAYRPYLLYFRTVLGTAYSVPDCPEVPLMWNDVT